jgi:type IV secretion system protein TrbL
MGAVMQRRLPMRLLMLVIVALLALGSAAPASAQDDGGDGNEHASSCSDMFTDAMNMHWSDAGGSALDCGKDTLTHGAPVEAALATGDAANGVKNWGEEKVEGVFKSMVSNFGTAALRGVMWMMDFWVRNPSNILLDAGGNVDDQGNSVDANGDGETSGSGLIGNVQNYTYWLQGLLGVLSVLAVAVRFIMSRWSDAEENATDFVMMLGRIIVTSTIWVPLIMLATKMTDGLSTWIIDESSKSASDGMKVFLQEDMPEGWAFAGAWSAVSMPGVTVMVLLGSILSIVTSVLQIFFSFIREGMLIILAAVMPMIAYGSGMKSGQEAWGKAKAWTLGLLLFKPAASLVYAIAFLAVGELGKDDTMSVLGVLVIFGMATFMLPSLVALVAPPTAGTLTGPSGGKVLGAAIGAAGTAVAIGATGAMGGGSAAMSKGAPKGNAGLNDQKSAANDDPPDMGGGGGDGPPPPPPPGGGAPAGPGDGGGDGNGGDGTGGGGGGVNGGGDGAPTPDGGGGTPPSPGSGDEGAPDGDNTVEPPVSSPDDGDSGSPTPPPESGEPAGDGAPLGPDGGGGAPQGPATPGPHLRDRQRPGGGPVPDKAPVRKLKEQPDRNPSMVPR